MKKTLQAAALVVLAATAILSAATNRQPNVKNYWPDEWNQTSKQSVKDSNIETTYSTQIFNTNK